MNLLAHLLSRHASLLLLGVFSACYFAAMIIARKILAPDDFYFWNSFVTLMAMGFTFCFFGTEQLFLRFSVVSDGRVSINLWTLILMLGTLVLFVVFLAVLSERYFFQLGTFVVYLVLGVCVGIFVFVYNFLRMLKAFSISQLAANGWKFTTLIAVVLAPLGHAPWVILTGLAAASGPALFLFLQNRHRLNITRDAIPDDWKALFLGFLVSLLVLMLLNNADRLIMSHYGSEMLFSEYVYLVTLLTMPFSLLSNYFGFKETAFLKQSYARTAFVKKSLSVALLSGGLYVPWFLLVYSLQGLLELSVQFEYLFPCLVLVTCRCVYALHSALFGLQGESAHIHLANLMTFVAIGTAVAVILLIGVNILHLLFLLAAFWCVRIAIYAYFTSHIKEYDHSYAV